jgi:DNA-binding XRE family transcriptional regulator
MKFRPRIAMREYEAVPDGFMSLENFVARHFVDPGRPSLSAIRRRKADELLAKTKLISPAYFRMAAGLSQSQLADLIGTSQPSIARIEAGLDRPSYDKLMKLQSALGVSFDQLMEALNNVPNEG